MNRTTILVGVVAGVAVALLAALGSGSGTALADAGPHVSSTGDATPDKCAGCHRIHTGQNDKLLKATGTIKDFCYTCHGNTGPGSDLAVQEGTFYGGTSPGNPYGGKTASTNVGLRAGGFDKARIQTNDPTNSTDNTGAVTIGVLDPAATVNSYHAIDGTLDGTMWGNGAIGSGAGKTYTLDCTSCHDPHGNGNYRILRSVPTGSSGGGYTVPDTYPKTPASYTTSNYFDMTFLHDASSGTTADTILKDTSAWCSQCHTRYLATRRAPGATPPACNPDASRQCSGDSIFNYRHTSSGYSVSSGGVGSNVTRACITCHEPHGSNAQMTGPLSSTVAWPGGGLVNPPNDTQRASLLKMDNRGMCKKCHGNK